MWRSALRGFSVAAAAWRPRWAHRLKRGQVELDAQRFAARGRRLLQKHARKGLALSAAGVFNGGGGGAERRRELDPCGIDDRVLEKLSDEMSEMEALKMATIVCGGCKKRLLINKACKGKEYCSCPDNKATTDSDTRWQPFLEDEDIIIWRREETPGDGLYSYKVYGCYREISAEDFLAMNLDTEYWRSWDVTAASLRVLEAAKDLYGGHCVMHWEMEWPKFFSNRDYVYMRKYAYMDGDTGKKCSNATNIFDEGPIKASYEEDSAVRIIDRPQTNASKTNKMIVIASRSCEHPDVPENPSVVRVKQYWSNMVIKPFSDFDKPGIEFSLTYYDDPGTNMPSAFQSWVAGYGMPDYLARMRKAAASYKETKGSVVTDLPSATTEDEKYENIFEETTFSASTVANNNITEAISAVNRIAHTTELEVAKTPDSTEEFLTLLLENASKSDVLESKADDTNEEKSVVGNIVEEPPVVKVINVHIEQSDLKILDAEKSKEDCAENAEKNPNQNQMNRYNYWHLWPLYYFA